MLSVEFINVSCLEVSSFPDFQSDPGYPKMTFDIYYEEQQDSLLNMGLSLSHAKYEMVKFPSQ